MQEHAQLIRRRILGMANDISDRVPAAASIRIASRFSKC